MRLALPAMARGALEGQLPEGTEAHWYADGDEALAAVRGADAAWLDILFRPGPRIVLEAAKDPRWISTALAGVNGWPLDVLSGRGQVLTNGAGVNAVPVAEFAVMGVLALAKDLRELIRLQDSRQWPAEAPGRVELCESKALIIGYGHIGREIATRLRSFGVEVTGVRRRAAGEAGVIGPGDWRGRLAEFDWIILATAATAETERMIGAHELAAMKPSAFLINIARGALVDQGALIAAARAGRIAGALLDVTEPEPPAPEDPIWSTPGILMTCHCSGRSQVRFAERASALFLDNLERFRDGRPLRNVVDLGLGY